MNSITNRETVLYRAFDKLGKLLYVGISVSFLDRILEHSENSGWFSQAARFELERFPNRYAAQSAERNAIIKEQPAFNRTHNYRAPVRRAQRKVFNV